MLIFLLKKLIKLKNVTNLIKYVGVGIDKMMNGGDENDITYVCMISLEVK